MDVAVGVGGPGELAHVVGQDAEALLAFAQAFLRANVVANIPRDLARADNMAFAVAHRGHGHRDVEQGAVFAEPLGEELADPFAIADTFEDQVFLVLAVGREQPADRLADHFVRGVAEQPLGRRIPRDDDAVQILRDNGIV